MSNNVVPISQAGEIMEQVLIRGDLAGLTHAERARYYTRVCQSIGVNPLTRPFDYIMLNGKLTLYALKGCTDQLRGIHGVSAYVVTHKEADGLFTVHVRVKDRDGREDEDFGVVSLPDTMKGDARANAIMKAITKAKRRATLSLCGLGMLDETELETIPESAKRPASTKPRTVMPAPRLLEKLSAAEEMNDELPGDLGQPKPEPQQIDRRYEDVVRQEQPASRRAKFDHTDHGGVPAFLDRRKANGAAEASFVDLVEGGQ